MDLRVLEYFLAAADEQNMRKAAEKVMTSQPNLSMQIRNLEKELGKELFIRSHKKLLLTEEGLYLRKQAKELLELADRTRQTIQNFDNELEGVIEIGAAESVGFTLVGRAAIHMMDDYPQIRFHITDGANYDFWDRLDRGTMDFALIVPEQSSKIDTYNSIELPIKDETVLVMPISHPLTSKKSISKEDLNGIRLFSGLEVFKKMTDSDLAQENNPTDNRLTYNLVTNTVSIVEDGLGCMLSFKSLIRISDNDSITWRPFNPPIYSPSYLIWRKYQILPRPAQIFLKYFQSVLDEWEADE